MSERRLTGKIHRSNIGRLELPPIPKEIIDGFRALEPDLSSLVSDVLDEMGAARAIPASVLRPIYAEAAIVGRALTLRNVAQGDSPYKGASAKISRLAEIEAHNLAEPGDVLVIEGVHDVSNIGGISAIDRQAAGRDRRHRRRQRARRRRMPQARLSDVEPRREPAHRQVADPDGADQSAWSRSPASRSRRATSSSPTRPASASSRPTSHRRCSTGRAKSTPPRTQAEGHRGGRARPDLANRAGSFTMPRQD